MTSRASLIAFALAGLLVSCSAPDRAPHPSAGILDLKQKHGWFGFSLTPKRHQRDLIVREIDGQKVRDPDLPLGIALAPGPHQITLTAYRTSMSGLGRKLGGTAGARLGRQMDENASTRYARTLTVNIIQGHDYVGYMRKRGDGYEYWIEDVTDDKIVADTRL